MFTAQYLYAMNMCRGAANEKDVTCPEMCSMVKDTFKQCNILSAYVKNMGDKKETALGETTTHQR
eukprot:9997749-Ditylum_brightwellii.AAC.1